MSADSEVIIPACCDAVGKKIIASYVCVCGGGGGGA